jgi:hypothetical protein
VRLPAAALAALDALAAAAAAAPAPAAAPANSAADAAAGPPTDAATAARDEAALLVALAAHLDAFIGELFGIVEPLQALRAVTCGPHPPGTWPGSAAGLALTHWADV